jgi:hypothetical protein
MLLGLLAVVVAQTPTVELRLTTSVGDAVCPDVAALKDQVSMQLGYSPFQPTSPTVYEVRASCITEGCAATLTISRPGEEPHAHTVSSPAGACNALFESVASAIVQAVNYESTVSRGLDAVEAPAPLALVPTKPEPAPPVHEIKTDFSFKGTFAGGVSAGLSLAPTAVLGASLGIGWRRLSLSAEGRFDLSQTVLVSGSSIQSSVIVATLAPCVHAWGFGACLLISSAAVHVKGDLEAGARDSASIFVLGPRLMYEWMFFEHVGLHAHVSLQGAFSTLSVRVNDQLIWTTARVTGDAAAGVVVVF